MVLRNLVDAVKGFFNDIKDEFTGRPPMTKGEESYLLEKVPNYIKDRCRLLGVDTIMNEREWKRTRCHPESPLTTIGLCFYRDTYGKACKEVITDLKIEFKVGLTRPELRTRYVGALAYFY